MIKSDGCRPDVLSSKSLKPVATPGNRAGGVIQLIDTFDHRGQDIFDNGKAAQLPIALLGYLEYQALGVVHQLGGVAALRG